MKSPAFDITKRIARLFATAYVVCFSLLVLVNLLPIEPFKENVLSTLSDVNYTSHPFIQGLSLDHFTECISLTIGIRSSAAAQSNETILTRAIVDAALSPTLGHCERIAEGEVSASTYYRYWHGAQVISRPVLTIATVPTLRFIVACAFLSALGFMLYAITRTTGRTAAISAGIIIAVSPIYSQLLLIPHAASWIIGCIGAGHILLSPRKDLHTNIVRFALIGILVAYFDLLNNPIVALTAALMAVTLRRIHDRREARIDEIVLLSAVWLFAYGGFWCLKWFTASAVLGGEVVWQTVYNQIAFRLNGDTTWHDVGVWTSIEKNFWFMRYCALAALIVSVITVILTLQRNSIPFWTYQCYATLQLVSQLLVVALLPVAWLLTLQNHSIVHHWFVAPILTISLICDVLAVQLFVRRAAKRRS